MNMVRAGVVSHPKEWPFCGYHEIQNPLQRYGIIDYQRLVSIFKTLGWPSIVTDYAIEFVLFGVNPGKIS